MDRDEISGILAIMDPNRYPAGQTIVKEGEPGEHFHVVISGKAKYSMRDAQEREITIEEVGPGGFFGELSMITGNPRVVSVQAVDDVETLALERGEFNAFLLSHPCAALDVITVLGRRLHRMESLLRGAVSRNVNEMDVSDITFGEKLADRFASMMGSWTFILIQSLILLVWVTLNCIGWSHGWDPYPFILLNLALSFQAAYSAPIIMMSQNRQADKDRLAAEIDHQVNVKAELEAGLIVRRLSEIEHQLAEQHRQQLSALNRP